MACPRSLRVLAVLIALGMVLGVGGGVTSAAFFATATNPANSISAAADWVAPTVTSSVIAKTTGYLAGSIRQGGTYYVYANVTDSGGPPSGVSSVSADVSSVTSGQTAASLSSGSFSVNGVSYNYRSAALTADNPLAAGSKPYSITSTDNAANARTQTGFAVMVDNTAPAGSDVQTADEGTPSSNVGRPEEGDRITFTYTEQIDPSSILSGWVGTSTSVTVRLNNGGAGNDTLTVFNGSNTVQLPLGTVNLGRTDYVTATMSFGSGSRPSAMVQTGATITITLGQRNGPASQVGTAGGPGTMSWTPSASATDAAGNACSTAVVTESGPADPEF